MIFMKIFRNRKERTPSMRFRLLASLGSIAAILLVSGIISIIEYRRMSKLPWIVEIYIDEAVIDNNVLTAEQMTVTRIAIIIIGLIVLAFPIVGDILYIERKYEFYKRAEKKRKRKARRALKKQHNKV